jgi:hypothetical protein
MDDASFSGIALEKMPVPAVFGDFQSILSGGILQWRMASLWRLWNHPTSTILWLYTYPSEK